VRPEELAHQAGGVRGDRGPLTRPWKLAGEKMGNRERKGILMNSESELEVFKTKIDLRQFAVSIGYEIDRRESWRGSTVLRRGPDKIVVKRNRNGHYVFFSVRDDSDNGTLIDFLKLRENLSLGAVRQILRPWIGLPPHRSFPSWSQPARIGCVSKASIGAWSTRIGTFIWSRIAVCRRWCCHRRGLLAV
jgi:hypothetical protein